MNVGEDTPISVSCSKCDHAFKVKSKAAGKTIRCPACRTAVQVPERQAAAGRSDDAESDNGWNFALDLSSSSGSGRTQPATFSPIDPSPPPEPAAVDIDVAQPSHPYAPAPAVAAAPAPAAAPASGLPASRSYPVLETMSVVCRVLGYLALILGGGFILLSFIFAVYTGITAEEGIFPALLFWTFSSIPTGIATVFIAGILVMNAEMIQLGIHIQANTLAAANALRR